MKNNIIFIIVCFFFQIYSATFPILTEKESVLIKIQDLEMIVKTQQTQLDDLRAVITRQQRALDRLQSFAERRAPSTQA